MTRYTRGTYSYYQALARKYIETKLASYNAFLASCVALYFSLGLGTEKYTNM